MTTLNITTGSITIANTIGGGINGIAYFTASATWTIPNGITKVRVIAIGGGGGGATGAAGGGGGGYAEDVVDVSSYSTLPVTVGSAGAQYVGGSNGGDGGDSGFLNVTASGGKGAIAGGATTNGGIGVSATLVGRGGYGDNLGGGVAGNLPWVFPLPTSVLNTSINLNTIGCGGYGNATASYGAVVIYY